MPRPNTALFLADIFQINIWAVGMMKQKHGLHCAELRVVQRISQQREAVKILQ